MGFVRAAVFTLVAVAIGGAAYVYRVDVVRLAGPYLGMGVNSTAKAAESQASPAAGAQPQGRRGRLNPGGAVPVVVMPVIRQPMPVEVDAVGTVQSIASVQIKPRMDSQIMKVNVEEGALVKEGDVLFELDGRALRAQLGQIDAQIRDPGSLAAQPYLVAPAASFCGRAWARQGSARIARRYRALDPPGALPIQSNYRSDRDRCFGLMR